MTLKAGPHLRALKAGPHPVPPHLFVLVFFPCVFSLAFSYWHFRNDGLRNVFIKFATFVCPHVTTTKLALKGLYFAVLIHFTKKFQFRLALDRISDHLHKDQRAFLLDGDRKSFLPHYMLLIEEILLSKVCGENQNVSFIASRMI